MKLSRRERKKLGLKREHEEASAEHEAHEEHAEHHAHHKKKPFLRGIYEDHYKKLLWIPILLFVFAIIQISVQVATTGDFLIKGVSLKGGLTITIHGSQSFDEAALKKAFSSEFPQNDINVRTLSELGKNTGLVIEADILPEDQAKTESFLSSIEQKLSMQRTDFIVESMGSSLGSNFFKEMIRSMIIAFIFMAIVVFITFRVPVPSLMVVSCALADILVTMAIVNLLGIKLSSAGIAAYLMLIGYSVDTDILLTTRVLKREGDNMTKIYGAMKTGIVMTLTILVAVIVGLILAKSDVLKQIMLIVMIGLLVDMIMTWIQNVALLRMYLDHKQKRGEKIEEVAAGEAE